MKKFVFTIILFIVIMAFAVAFASNDYECTVIKEKNTADSTKLINHTINLPSSVEIIEDEAFEGTAIVSIVLPDTLTTIGNRAFANIKALRSIRIPATTTSISQTAFIGSNNVMINADPNSYARTWAKENKVPFSPITVMYAGTGGQNVTGSLTSVSKEILDTESSETQETKRTWRNLEEIQVHDTIEIIANVIQGRAPPMA